MRTRITLRLLACVLAASLAAPAIAATQTPAPDAGRRLVGIWQDDKDPENIVQFNADRTLRIYLSPSEGQAQNAHWIDGTWTLAEGGKLTMQMNVPGVGVSTIKTRQLTLVFTRKGFIVKDGGKVIGRQHRISERTLKKHLW